MPMRLAESDPPGPGLSVAPWEGGTLGIRARAPALGSPRIHGPDSPLLHPPASPSAQHAKAPLALRIYSMPHACR